MFPAVRALPLLLLASAAAANPLDAFGFGARAIGMGSAHTAVAEDFSANYYNPAGLAAGRDLRLDVGYVLSDPALDLGGDDNGVDDSRGIQGGVVLASELFEHGFGLSIGVHLPDERVSRIRALPQRQPRWVLYDNRPQRIVISSSAGVEILEGLYLGAGLTYLANTSGTLEIRGDVSATDAEQTTLLSAVDVDLAAIRYWTVGARYDLGDHWSLGATWRQDFALRLDLDVDVRGRVLIGDRELVPDASFVFNSGSASLYSPQQVFLGAAWADLGWLVSLDLGWIDWSRFPPPTATVGVELELGVLDPEIPLPEAPEAPRFHDTFVPRAGVEYTALEHPVVGLDVRAGYFYEPSPAPDQPGLTNYVDADKHAVSLGLGVRLTDPSGVFPKPVHFDLAVQLVELARRTYTKDDPADPVGDYVADGRVWTLGSNLGFPF